MAFWDRKKRKRRGRKLTTPDGLNAVTLPSGWAEMLGLRGTYGHLYRSQPNVRSVVDFVATQAASIKLHLYERVPESARIKGGALDREDHELMRLLNRPSPRVTRYRFWKSIVSDTLIYDVAYAQKVRIRNKVLGIVRVPPTALVPERDPVTNRIKWYNTTIGTKIQLDELVVFPGYDPENQEGSASILETLRYTLEEEFEANRQRRFLWRNATRKSGIIERPLVAPPWLAEEREAWRADFEGIMSTHGNAGRVAILEDSMQWKDVNWSPQEMEYLEARKLTRQECASVIGVDPRLVYAHEEAATAEIRTGWYVDRLAPYLTQLQEEIDAQLLPDFEPFDSTYRFYNKFNIEARMRGSFAEQIKYLITATGRAFLEPNEAREILDYMPLPEGEGLTIPLNVALGGQASPFSPTGTPGEGTEPGETPGPPRQASIAVSMTPEELAWVRSIMAGKGKTQIVEPPEEKSPPWHIEERDGRYCVIVNETDKEVGCHDTQAEAEDHLAALYANVDEGKAQEAEATIRKFLERQERTVASQVAAARKAGTDWDPHDERWDRELIADLLPEGKAPGKISKLVQEFNLATIAACRAPDAEVSQVFSRASDRAPVLALRIATITGEVGPA